MFQESEGRCKAEHLQVSTNKFPQLLVLRPCSGLLDFMDATLFACLQVLAEKLPRTRALAMGTAEFSLICNVACKARSSGSRYAVL